MSLTPLQTAVDLLKAGELVALSTETVYGLGADARNESALTKIFLAKERPFTHPLIVHLASFDQIPEWALDIPEAASKLAQTFWPGPLTLILKKQKQVSELVSGGQDTIGLRIPAHPVALALLQAFGSGIAAPSANRYTHLSPTTAQAVREELGSKVSCILEGGTCEVGLESTILDLSSNEPRILRPGMISAGQIETLLGQKLSPSKQAAPRVSGMELVHYAPETEVILVNNKEISAYLKQLQINQFPLAFLVYNRPSLELEGVNWILMPHDPKHYAHDLYLTLRALDKQGFKQIVIENPPKEAPWDAINDRLTKAAAKNRGESNLE